MNDMTGFLSQLFPGVTDENANAALFRIGSGILSKNTGPSEGAAFLNALGGAAPAGDAFLLQQREAALQNARVAEYKQQAEMNAFNLENARREQAELKRKRDVYGLAIEDAYPTELRPGTVAGTGLERDDEGNVMPNVPLSAVYTPQQIAQRGTEKNIALADPAAWAKLRAEKAAKQEERAYEMKKEEFKAGKEILIKQMEIARPDMQIIQGDDGNVYGVDKRTGKVSNLTEPVGQTLSGEPAAPTGTTPTGEVPTVTTVTPRVGIKETPAQKSQREVGEQKAKEQAKVDVEYADNQKKAKSAVDALTEAQTILESGKPTHSGIGTAVDKAAGFFGVSTTGAEADARLDSIAQNLVTRMPRLPGAASDRDVARMDEAIGKIGDGTLPIEVRLAAVKEAQKVLKGYYKLDESTGGGGGKVNTPTPAGKTRVKWGG